MIVHVVRCFEDSNVVHVDGSVNPLRDIETINLELIFSDLEILERRIAKVAKGARMDKEQAKELAMLERVKERLEDGKLAIGFETEDEDGGRTFQEPEPADCKAGDLCGERRGRGSGKRWRRQRRRTGSQRICKRNR